MKKFLTAVIFGAALAAGCTSVPVAPITDAPIHANARSRDVGQVIESALNMRGWQISARRPGAIDAFLAVRNHRADVTVTYDEDSYSIEYRDSEGLDYRNGNIHRNYNRWVAYLNQDIQNLMASPPR